MTIGSWVKTPDGRGKVSELKGAGTPFFMLVVTFANGDRRLYKSSELELASAGKSRYNAPVEQRRSVTRPLQELG